MTDLDSFGPTWIVLDRLGSIWIALDRFVLAVAKLHAPISSNRKKNWFDLEEKIKRADIILTGEGRFDKTSLYGKGPYEIIQMASEFEKKIILLAGSVDFEVVSRLHSDFSNLIVVPFSKESLELSENLARAPEFFKEKLRETLIFLK